MRSDGRGPVADAQGTEARGRVIRHHMHQPAAASRHRASRSASQSRARYSRALRVGLAISAILHLVAVVVVSDWLAPPEEQPAARQAPVLVTPPRGLRAVDLSVVDAGRPVVPERPAPAPEPEPERSRPAPAVTPEPDATPVPADQITAADRLAPRVVDPRLWRPMVLMPREPTLEDVEARIAAAVELLSDSALAEAEAALRARDWTVTDAEGRRWGISPGKLHLGSLTLPIPIWFPVDPGAEADRNAWYELDGQMERARVLESFEDRVRAIRERRERERAGKADNGGH